MALDIITRRAVLLVAVLNFMLVDSSVQAQVCDGNLGENIFVDGDFGRGTANIVSPDPEIAPGFQYVFTGPPLDGEYTITNNTAVWAGLWESWLGIGDNSPDSNGYMMVVNASFDPSLFYEQTIDGLCENTTYQFSADLLNIIQPDAAVPHIKPNVTFLIDGEVRYTTGDIPQNATWTTYAFTFSTAPGQSSVTLGISNNAPGGIGNDIGLDNFSFKACGPYALILPLERAVACEDGEPLALSATLGGNQYNSPAFQWQQSFDEGATWQDIAGANELSYLHTNLRIGSYYYRYLLANGTSNLASDKCRVVSNAKIVYVQPKAYAQADTVCKGGALVVGNRALTETGVYIDTLTSSLGCDSIITTSLTVEEESIISSQLRGISPSCTYLENGRVEATIPLGGNAPYTYTIDGLPIANGQSISGLPAGTFDYTIRDRNGCRFDSTVQLVAPAPFVIDIGPDKLLELGETAQVEVIPRGDNVEAVKWSDPTLINCDLPCAVVDVQPKESMQLIAAATSARGCASADSLFISVDKVRKHFFPSAFSPNGDGVNDYFTGFGASPNVELVEHLLVFDRWGTLLFDQTDLMPNDQRAGWDGSQQGKALDEGTYVFTARVRYFDGEVAQVSGEVTLVR